MKSKKNLTRFSYESTGFRGWRVSVTRYGEVFTRYFSDKVHGTSRKSLDAAQKCLDKFLTTLDKTPVVVTKRKGGKNGTTGVSETRVIHKPTGEERIVWVSSWPEDGRRRVVKFPVSKHGARKAKQLAVEARKDAEERLGLNLVKRFKREDADRLRQVLAEI